MNLECVTNRKSQVEKLRDGRTWDMIVIGGGATGLGVAVEAAARGFKTVLLEQCDFAKGTSSRSTKLVHGGVRYLAQGDVKLVIDALRERGILLQNAPHLVRKQSFIIPCYSIPSKLKYLAGLKIYDWLSGKYSFGKSRLVSKKEVMNMLPGIKEKNLSGGIEYFDGQFDDARLAVNLAQTAVEQGAVVLNYMKVTGLQKNNGVVSGVRVTDAETGESLEIAGKTVVNATGVFVDDILQMDEPEADPLVRSSQGVHLVFAKETLPVQTAMMIPKTSDGRVLFAVPWHDHILVGTTDTPLDSHSLEPVALDKEISFILSTISNYFDRTITKKDALSVFAGLRPLAAPKKDTGSTKEISRDHKLMISTSKLITITGGKWTTYRKMGEETVNMAISAGLEPKQSRSKALPIHGAAPMTNEHLSVYGTDAAGIEALMKDDTRMGNALEEGLPYTEAEVIWAVRNEMARTVEDVLARRMRLLFLDAGLAVAVAPKVAQLMAAELGHDGKWEQEQVDAFSAVAKNYQLTSGKLPAKQYSE